VDDIPDCPAPDNPDFPVLFKRKLQLCSQICPFGPGSEDAVGAKTHQLIDLLAFAVAEAASLADAEFNQFYDMVEANLIRPIVPGDPRLSLQDDLPPTYVIEWPHLTVIYQILLQLLTKVPQSPRHLPFAQRLIPVCDSPDPNERSAIVRFYEQLSRSVPPARDYLLTIFSAYIELHVIGSSRCPFLVWTLLSVFEALLGQSSPPVEQNHLFLNVILPLLRHPYLRVFGDPMGQVIGRLQDSGQANALAVVKYLLAKWPRNLPSKQVFFVDFVVSGLSRLRSLELVMPRIKALVNELGESTSTRVVGAFLSVWLKPAGDRVLTLHGSQIIPIVKMPLAELAASHWSSAIRTSARAMLTMLQRREGRSIRSIFQRDLPPEKPPGLSSWTAIVNAATVRDAKFEKVALLGEVYALYAPKPVVVEAPVMALGVGRMTSDKDPGARPQPATRQILQPRFSSSALADLFRM
jgi:hypothetical protein